MRHRVVRTIVVRIGFAVGRLRGPRARVVLATSHTSALTGNLRFIAEELGATHPEIPIATLTLRRGGRLRRLAPLISTFMAGYHLAASRVVVVDDYFFPMYVITPRPGTTRVQVWHAAGAFKRFGFSRAGQDLRCRRGPREARADPLQLQPGAGVVDERRPALRGGVRAAGGDLHVADRRPADGPVR